MKISWIIYGTGIVAAFLGHPAWAAYLMAAACFIKLDEIKDELQP